MKPMIPVTNRYVNHGKSIVVGVEDDNLIDTLVFDGLPDGDETLFTMVDNAGKYVCEMTGAELPLTSRITASGGKVDAMISVANGEKLWHTRPFVIVIADGLPDAETVEVDPAIEERLISYTRDAVNAAERAEMATNRAAEVVDGIEAYAEEAAQSAELAKQAEESAAEMIEDFDTALAAQKEEIAQSVNRAETAKEGAEKALADVKEVIASGGTGGGSGTGQDGYSPIANVTKSGKVATITITDKVGTTTATVSDGKDGADGKTPVKGVDYFDGKDGKTPVKGVDYFDGQDGKTPVKGVDYTDGKDGKTPVKGVDYWTEQDKRELISQIPSADPDTIRDAVNQYLSEHPIEGMSELTKVAIGEQGIKTITVAPDVSVGFTNKAGTQNGNDVYRRTTMISVQPGDTITVICKDGNIVTEALKRRFTCAFLNNVVQPDKGSDVEGAFPYTVPDGVDGIVFSFQSRYTDVVFTITRGTTSEIVYFNPKFDSPNVRRVINGAYEFKAFKNAMTENEHFTIAERMDIKRNCSFHLMFNPTTMGSIYIGHGRNVYGASYVKVDETNIVVYYYGASESVVMTKAHGLTIKDYAMLNINVSPTSRASIELFTNGGTYKINDAGWQGCNGNVEVWAESGAYTNVVGSWTVSDLTKAVYLFGDSYTSLNDPSRWTTQMANRGYTNFLISGFGGATSEDQYVSLTNILDVASPKVLVWALGMNDPDNGAVNADWLATLNRLINLCECNTIELVLATIPNTPSHDNSYKNAHVRSLPYRYIDFAKAVGADTDTTWYDNMMHSDRVHPIEQGAIALMARAIVDCPELVG